ncbi:hypothetical protein MJG53_012133 [Ovis ammon polii x Ovis aries]|uniref:Uncharacterized protein n=1 Tax=Ovis ammon polii x Ovis aries TaxID=2918886 RepID=A0ACB9URH5_9CETA|nr:hypothetical protein MJG53_012133 [Ovis ammon polii x Ovis aries]
MSLQKRSPLALAETATPGDPVGQRVAPWHATCQIPYPVAYLPPAWTHTGGLPHQKPASGLPRHFRIPEGKGQILTRAEIKKEHRPSLVTHRLIGTLIKLLKLEYIYPGYLHRKGACSDNGSAMKFCERQVSQNQLLPDVIKHGSKQQEGRPGYPNLIKTHIQIRSKQRSTATKKSTDKYNRWFFICRESELTE